MQKCNEVPDDLIIWMITCFNINKSLGRKDKLHCIDAQIKTRKPNQLHMHQLTNVIWIASQQNNPSQTITVCWFGLMLHLLLPVMYGAWINLLAVVTCLVTWFLPGS